MEKKVKFVKGFQVTRQINEFTELQSVVYFTLLERKKTVICDLIVRGGPDGEQHFTAKAVCQEGDTFSLEEGMNVALAKAQAKVRISMDHILKRVEKRLNVMTEGIVESTNIRHAQMIRNKKYKLRV